MFERFTNNSRRAVVLAQNGAREELSHLRYADNNYFFILRYDGLSVLQPDRSQEGKNLIDNMDPYGVPTSAA